MNYILYICFTLITFTTIIDGFLLKKMKIYFHINSSILFRFELLIWFLCSITFLLNDNIRVLFVKTLFNTNNLPLNIALSILSTVSSIATSFLILDITNFDYIKAKKSVSKVYIKKLKKNVLINLIFVFSSHMFLNYIYNINKNFLAFCISFFLLCVTNILAQCTMSNVTSLIQSIFIVLQTIFSVGLLIFTESYIVVVFSQILFNYIFITPRVQNLDSRESRFQSY